MFRSIDMGNGPSLVNSGGLPALRESREQWLGQAPQDMDGDDKRQCPVSQCLGIHKSPGCRVANRGAAGKDWGRGKGRLVKTWGKLWEGWGRRKKDCLRRLERKAE
ncbi:hypothetical protein Pmani_029844 [Petrolisthes manimaculis]|uniref:Uncharacterized protein n=1 Tax=Petrolisthes manimaculis TaxID=1843537 RepID=A0AAE1TTH3_9EUCA|nr:hypothetical protein Pmani_029844 [Petrolisthes manimaculis]